MRSFTSLLLFFKYAAREAETIAQAGRKHAITISTNMAGRGTDIILGGNPKVCLCMSILILCLILTHLCVCVCVFSTFPGNYYIYYHFSVVAPTSIHDLFLHYLRRAMNTSVIFNNFPSLTSDTNFELHELVYPFPLV